MGGWRALPANGLKEVGSASAHNGGADGVQNVGRQRPLRRRVRRRIPAGGSGHRNKGSTSAPAARRILRAIIGKLNFRLLALLSYSAARSRI